MVPIGVLGLLLCTRLCGGTGELRLADGGVRCAGRVEVKHQGEWGSVCNYDFDWEARWAAVVCRQLGCGRPVRSSPYAPFGQGTGRIWLHVFFCRGNEDVLQSCPHFGWGQHFCGHELDVGVTCEEAVELRLAAGWGPCSGRVEVKLRGHWGTVADDNWHVGEAEVVCQQLGCGSAAGAYFANTLFGKGDGPISLALVGCSGVEATLWDCEIRGWGPYSAIHDFDTAVVCQGFARLVGGDSDCAGRLEVRRGRAWTGVCEDHVDIKAAQVVCRELGCGTALGVTGTAWPEAESRLFWEEGFECNGTEHLLATCARRQPQGQGCAGHAIVICSPYRAFRLADATSSCAGRVEVEVKGTWRSLCATSWDLPDAHVLCHHLGCGSAVAVLPGGSFGQGHGPLWPDAFGCDGSERHPGECPVAVLGEPSCPLGHAAAVTCSGHSETPRLVEGQSRCDGRLEVTTSPGASAPVAGELWDTQDARAVCGQLDCGVPEEVYTLPGSGTAGLQCNGTKDNLAQCNVSEMATVPTSSPEQVTVVCSGSRRVRLAGGPRRCAGRVEVYDKGTWATICQDTWDTPDATVVCRQLGCGTALAVPISAPFGPGTGPLWLGTGGCAGTEESLWECPALAWRGCQRGGGASVICSEQLSLRLVGGRDHCEGHLEVFYNGTWGRVCAKGTSPATAIAVCWQLDCGNWGRLAAAPAQEPAPAWLAWVHCEEGTRSLWQCPSAPWHLQACSPGGDTHVTCDKDRDDTIETSTPSPGVPSSSAPAGTVPAPTVLCVVLGMLLCLALCALAMQMCRVRARRRVPITSGSGRAADAISDAIYEELDYTVPPDYQEVPSLSGSLSEGSGMKLPYYTGDSEEEREPKAAPDPPAQCQPLDGYDDATVMPEGSPAASTGGITRRVMQISWGCDPPTGGSCSPPSSLGATEDPPAQPPGDTDYDDVALGVSP